MESAQALTVLVRRHQIEFNKTVDHFAVVDSLSSRRSAKRKAARFIANKYQKEYVQLRGKGGHDK